MVVVDELHIVHSGTSTDLTAGAHAHQQVLPQSMVDEHGLERVDDRPHMSRVLSVCRIPVTSSR